MRCMTSGRLTPAASTAISTSPAAGRGTGRSTGFSTSGPPASAGSIAVMVLGTGDWGLGTGGMVLITPRSPRIKGSATAFCLTSRPKEVDSPPMDLDELFPAKPGDPLVMLVKQDLDPL